MGRIFYLSPILRILSEKVQNHPKTAFCRGSVIMFCQARGCLQNLFFRLQASKSVFLSRSKCGTHVFYAPPVEYASHLWPIGSKSGGWIWSWNPTGPQFQLASTPRQAGSDRPESILGSPGGLPCARRCDAVPRRTPRRLREAPANELELGTSRISASDPAARQFYR